MKLKQLQKAIDNQLAGDGSALRFAARELHSERNELRQALNDARGLLQEAAGDEINTRDELEKWDRAYGHLLSNGRDEGRAGSAQ